MISISLYIYMSDVWGSEFAFRQAPVLDHYLGSSIKLILPITYLASDIVPAMQTFTCPDVRIANEADYTWCNESELVWIARAMSGDTDSALMIELFKKGSTQQLIPFLEPHWFFRMPPNLWNAFGIHFHRTSLRFKR
jgi:hypothetical protein